MTERVDAAPQIDQPPTFPPPPDALGIDARGEQLPSRDHTMLPFSKRPDETNGRFVFHTDT